MTTDKTSATAPLALKLTDGFGPKAQEPRAWLWEEATYQEFDVRGRCWRSCISREHPGMPWMVRNVTPLYDITAAPVAVMDTREVLGLCAPTEEDFPALYALRGRRVALVDLGPNVL